MFRAAAALSALNSAQLRRSGLDFCRSLSVRTRTGAPEDTPSVLRWHRRTLISNSRGERRAESELTQVRGTLLRSLSKASRLVSSTQHASSLDAARPRPEARSVPEVPEPGGEGGGRSGIARRRANCQGCKR